MYIIHGLKGVNHSVFIFCMAGWSFTHIVKICSTVPCNRGSLLTLYTVESINRSS